MFPHAVLLAATAPPVPADDKVTPGLLGFLVVAALGVGIWVLMRSMNRHLRKVAPKSDEQRPGRR